jgi:AcrR family transcriptional regulator
MILDNVKIWIVKGYEIFALHGQSRLKVEPLAKEVGKSKSSFYHHFADLEVFMEYLLNYHIEQAYIIAEKERNAQSINPELINLLVEHKTDLLFNRQLRINQNIESFATVLEQSDKIVGDAFINLWVKDQGLQLTPKQIEGIFTLALENFYLQINPENLNPEWLATYFENLNKIVSYFD